MVQFAVSIFVKNKYRYYYKYTNINAVFQFLADACVSSFPLLKEKPFAQMRRQKEDWGDESPPPVILIIDFEIFLVKSVCGRNNYLNF